MSSHFDHFGTRLIEWLFRPKPVGRYVMASGLSLIGIAFALGWALKISLPYGNGRFDFALTSGEGTPAILTWLAAGTGLLVLIIGLGFEARRLFDERQRLSRKRVLVIEGRGLRDGPGSPLADAVSPRFDGQRETIILDLRQKLEDGRIVEPAAIIPRIETLATQVDQRTSSMDRSDLTIVYGGLTAVPFTFLTGVIMDDEGHVLVLDWDRKQERWRELDESDDGQRFTVTNAEGEFGSDIVLAVGVSYPIVESNLHLAFPSLPVVGLTLGGGGPHSHWSESKQRSLADQFLQTAIKLSGMGVKRIHLILAAPNSVAFGLGRSYDKRNLPPVIVYQFENGSIPPYPWGVAMPVAGASRATIVRTTM
jgi:hypothetical protein